MTNTTTKPLFTVYANEPKKSREVAEGVAPGFRAFVGEGIDGSWVFEVRGSDTRVVDYAINAGYPAETTAAFVAREVSWAQYGRDHYWREQQRTQH